MHLLGPVSSLLRVSQFQTRLKISEKAASWRMIAQDNSQMEAKDKEMTSDSRLLHSTEYCNNNRFASETLLKFQSTRSACLCN